MTTIQLSKIDSIKLQTKHKLKSFLRVPSTSPQIALAKLIKDNPDFHSYEGELTNWSIQADTLRYLSSLLKPGMVTLETGCGQSTVVFSIYQTKHICVMPNADEAKRVKQYCMLLGVQSNVNFLIQSSDKALPNNARLPKVFDHLFIDGAHAFPAPIVDWHYTAPQLKVGGILSLDDYKMPSVKVLFDFMLNETEWELVDIVQNTAFFKKVDEVKDIVDWSSQVINKDYPGY